MALKSAKWKLHKGPRGGIYSIKHGKKIYKSGEVGPHKNRRSKLGSYGSRFDGE